MTTQHRDLPIFADFDDSTPTDDARTLKARIFAAIRQAVAANTCTSVASANGERHYVDFRLGAAHGAVGRARLLSAGCTARHAAEGSPLGTEAFGSPSRPAPAV